MNRLAPLRLPDALRYRAEFLGLVSGSVVLPLSWGVSWFGPSFAGPLGIVLRIVLGSVVAGIGGCLLGSRNDGDMSIAFAPRVGVRASIIAGVFGASLVVLSATFRAFGFGRDVSGGGALPLLSFLFPQAHAFQICAVALVGIPPAIFFGTAASILTALKRTSVPATGNAPTKQSRSFRSPLSIAIWSISVLGFLSPFAVQLQPKPKSVAVAPIAEQPSSTPPKWRYQKPEGFEHAEAAQIAITSTQFFGNVESALPVALAPSEKTFAYFTRTPRLAVEVRDLEQLDVVAHIEIPNEPISLAWSPNSERLLIQTKGETRRLSVIRLNPPQLLPLPQPIGDRIPEGRVHWFADDEVAFGNAGEPVIVSLDTLRTVPLDNSASWLALSKERQEAIRSGGPIPQVQTNWRWEIAVVPMIRRYEVLNAGMLWKTNSWTHVNAMDEGRSYRSFFPIDINAADRLLTISDGTKLIRIRDQTAAIFYFGLREAPSTTIHITMPSPPDASTVEALQKMNVCAFVCAPLVNPLNGKTVGPDRSLVKAIARFKSWTEKDAELWIAEDYIPLRSGDVVADLHTLRNHNFSPVGDFAKDEWFAVLQNLDRGSPPARSAVPVLDGEVSAHVNSASGGNRAEKVAAPSPSPPRAADPAAASGDIAETIRLFIVNHHAKSSRNDVEGLVSDYGEHVDSFDNGIVDRAFIRKDEQQYHAPGTRVTETVTTPVTSKKSAENTYDVSYSISFNRVKPDGHWTRGVSDVQLRIVMTDRGPQIMSQHAQAHDLQKGP